MFTNAQITRLVLLAAVFAFGHACPPAGAPMQEIAARDPIVPPDTLITLERTECFGSCPVYKITISADGRVLFEGRQFVRVGKAESMITQVRLRELLAAFDKIHYFDLRNRYAKPEDGCQELATDHPSATTSIRINGKSKSVSHYYGCRGMELLAALEKLEQAIDDAVGSARWIR